MDTNRRNLLLAGLSLPLIAAKRPPAGVDWNSWFQDFVKRDFAMIDYYRQDNAGLMASGKSVDLVFMGDSITEGWFDKRPAFFRGGRVNRGIGGQTTSQMVLRMIPDVVAIGAKAVHIMAGTNDIAGNTGPMTLDMTKDNFRAMAAIAKANGVKLFLASVPPAANFPWRPGLDTLAPIRNLNLWLRDFAARQGAVWIDYHSALADRHGGMRPGFAGDGVHPTEQGYAAMEPVLEARLPAAMRLRKR